MIQSWLLLYYYYYEEIDGFFCRPLSYDEKIINIGKMEENYSIRKIAFVFLARI